MLLRTLGACLLRIKLAAKFVGRAGEEFVRADDRVIRAGNGVIRARLDF